MKEIVKNNIISIILIAAVTVWGLLCYDKLPTQVPTHFDLNGNADKFSPREFVMWFIPAISLFVLLVVSGLLKVSPEKFSASQSLSAISKLNFGIVLFLMTIHFATIKEALEPGLWMKMTLPFSMAVLTIFIGNYLGKLEKNFIVGIRVPWTIASDENWKHTHRFAGKTYFVAGIISLAAALLYTSAFVSVGLLLLASLVSVGYSFFYFQKYEKAKQ